MCFIKLYLSFNYYFFLSLNYHHPPINRITTNYTIIPLSSQTHLITFLDIMNRLFGRSKNEAAAPKPTLEDATSRLETRGAALEQRIGKFDAELLKLKQVIQNSRGPNKERAMQRAMQLLQQKRMVEGQRNQMAQHQWNIEQMQYTREMMQDTKMQVEVMKDSHKMLTKEFKNFKVGDVEKMHDQLRDLYEDAAEIQEIMGRDYELNDPVDEDDLRDELDALAFDMEKEKDASYLDAALATPAPTTGVRLPDLNVPNVAEQPMAVRRQEITETDLGL